MKKFGIFWVFAITIYGCSSVKSLAVETDITRTLNRSAIFNSQFTGFSIFDLNEGKFLAGVNDTKKFTPASNTKILTMYVSLKSLGDSIPGLLYKATQDSVMVQPIGDPTFLHPDFSNQKAVDFLNSYDSIRIVWPINEVKQFGSGWAWDDYPYDFQPQISWWPIYGNKVDIIKRNDSIQVSPPFFEEYVEVLKEERPGEKVERNLKYNLFKVFTDNDTSSFKRSIPIDYSKEVLIELLGDSLKPNFQFSNNELIIAPDTLYTQSLDTVLSVMMKESDNFLAEHLLLQSARKNGYNGIDSFIKHVKLIWLSDLNEFVWVDGSGLSRYNLIAPVDVVRLYKKSIDEFGLDRIKSLLAVGGQSGTIEDWYGAEEPYIWAKTGTLSNNHNLSGLLRTRSGKWMIFSFMNNHFTAPLDSVKSEMQSLLEGIRDSY